METETKINKFCTGSAVLLFVGRAVRKRALMNRFSTFMQICLWVQDLNCMQECLVLSKYGVGEKLFFPHVPCSHRHVNDTHLHVHAQPPLTIVFYNNCTFRSNFICFGFKIWFLKKTSRAFCIMFLPGNS